MRTDKNYDGPTITVRQVRLAIGNKPKNCGTLRALGLRKIGDTNASDRPRSGACCFAPRTSSRSRRTPPPPQTTEL